MLGIDHGNQELQHLVLSVRAAIPPGFHVVRLTEVGVPGVSTRQRVPWRAVGGGLAGASSLSLVIPAPNAVIAATDLTMRVEVEDDVGLGWTEFPVRFAWAGP